MNDNLLRSFCEKLEETKAILILSNDLEKYKSWFSLSVIFNEDIEGVGPYDLIIYESDEGLLQKLQKASSLLQKVKSGGHLIIQGDKTYTEYPQLLHCLSSSYMILHEKEVDMYIVIQKNE